MTTAYLLTRQWHESAQGLQLEFWCTSPAGPIRLLINTQEAVFFVNQKAIDRIRLLLPKDSFRVGQNTFKNFCNDTTVPLYFLSYKQARNAEAQLNKHKISVWEADIRPPERYLMERFITAGVRITGQYKKYNHHLEYINPKLTPCAALPTLRSLSIDIETTMDANNLYSIAAYNEGTKIVFMIDATAREISSNENTKTQIITHYYPNEKSCLLGFYLRK